jgi:hypothetical protein
MTRRFGSETAPATTKFDFWGSMADLGRLVMRSGASRLRVRIGAALGLVLLGKLAGVWAPVVLGDSITRLSQSVAGGHGLSGGYVAGALVYAALMLVAAWIPFVRDAIFTRVSQATMAMAARAPPTF